LSFLFVAVLFGAGCSGPIQMAITSDDAMNEGNALTAVYAQLTGVAAFEGASYVSFWENDNAALAGDLAAPKQRIVLYPGRETTLEIRPTKGTMFIGIAANYRSPDPEGWRMIFPVEEVKGKTIRLTADRNRLFAEVN